MNSTKWFDRVFDFQQESQDFPIICQRLKEAPQQLRRLVSGLNIEQLRFQPGGKWSVAEHCGHLLVLEPLWKTRIVDIMQEQAVLTAADLENKATFDAGFNEWAIDAILTDFERERQLTLQQLDRLTSNDLLKQSMHPRIKKPMRIVDHMYFVAEHDAHHLASIREIIAAGF
jgi:uncharacterized damage-inducible protein DinB